MSSNYEVVFGKEAKDNLVRINKNDARIIMAWISKNLVNCKNPYKCGEPLKSGLKGEWKYKVGDYRLITNINHDKVTILILEIGHKRGFLRETSEKPNI